MVKISPSVLAADFSRLEAEIKKVEAAGADWLHLDVMDGNYVPSISFGVPVIVSLRKVSGIFFDTHLMIIKPENCIKQFAEAGSNLITFHVEATRQPRKVIALIRDHGIKVGISANAKIPAKKILPFLPEVDLALIMSVHAGFGGQKFMPEALAKLGAVKQAAEKQKLQLEIQVDGGINAETAKQAIAAGANNLVAGTSVFGAADMKKAIDELRNSK